MASSRVSPSPLSQVAASAPGEPGFSSVWGAPLVSQVGSSPNDELSTVREAAEGALTTAEPEAVPCATACVSSLAVAVSPREPLPDCPAARSPIAIVKPSSLTVTPLTGTVPVLVTA